MFPLPVPASQKFSLPVYLSYHPLTASRLALNASGYLFSAASRIKAMTETRINWKPSLTSPTTAWRTHLGVFYFLAQIFYLLFLASTALRERFDRVLHSIDDHWHLFQLLLLDGNLPLCQTQFLFACASDVRNAENRSDYWDLNQVLRGILLG